jgi:DnaJ-domain-containing protein 1
MRPSRPYSQKSTKELAALFATVKADLPTVKLIFAELKKYRSTPSAHALRDKVEKHLKAIGQQKETEEPTRADKPSGPEQPIHHVLDCKGCSTKIRIPIIEDRIIYRCPKCRLSFEAEYRAGIVEIVFFMEETTTVDQGSITEETARSILGVPVNAPFSEIKTAWRRLSQQYHPDKHQGLPERLRKAAEVEVGRINQAYRVLARVSAEEF